MTKNKKRLYILTAVMFVVYSVVAFAPPFERNTAFYISYIFGGISVLSQIYIQTIAFDGAKSVSSRVYGFPIAKVGIIYMAVQVVLSIAIMIFAENVKVWVVLVLSAVITARAVAGFIATDTAREEVVEIEKTEHRVTNTMRMAQAKAASFVSLCTNEEIKKSVTRLADKFRYSDPVSNESTAEYDENLSVRLETLRSAILRNNAEAVQSLCADTSSYLDERNAVAKRSK